jgi:uncharacterized membrane protein
MLRPIGPRVVVLLFTLGLVGLFARPAIAADWALAPADNGFGSGRQDFRHTLNPGGELEDGITVFNNGTAPLEATLRVADGLDGVRLSTDAVTVPAGGSEDVPFTVTLPKDAAPGDRVGGIVVSAGGSQSSLPINLRVGGPLKPGLAVEDVQVDYSGGDAVVTYTVHNTGNATLTARQTVSVSGPFGAFKAEHAGTAESPPLRPGARWKGTQTIADVTPSLRLTASVAALPLLTDEAGSTAPLKEIKVSGHGWAFPLLPIVGLVVLIALAAAAAGSRRRRRRPVFAA